MRSVVGGLAAGLLLYGFMSMIISMVESQNRDETYTPPVFGWFRFIIALGFGLLVSLA